jgi:hypothetical protein
MRSGVTEPRRQSKAGRETAAVLGASQFPASAGEGQNPKLETRNPKSEGNPKSEIRIVAEPQSAGLARLGCRDGSRKSC